jgi:signal transduction histidine kinase
MEILGHLNETAEGTLKELRRLVMELSPSPLEDHGLVDALDLHCDLFSRRQKVQMDLNLNYGGELQPDQEVAIYRITQEALANIQKHASASHIHVSLISEKDATVLTIRDNGTGFDAGSAKKGQGLKNIADRTRQSGGKLQIQSGPGQGTTISVEYIKQQ